MMETIKENFDKYMKKQQDEFDEQFKRMVVKQDQLFEREDWIRKNIEELKRNETSSSSSSSSSSTSKKQCVICLENAANHICIPCGHVNLCPEYFTQKKVQVGSKFNSLHEANFE